VTSAGGAGRGARVRRARLTGVGGAAAVPQLVEEDAPLCVHGLGFEGGRIAGVLRSGSAGWCALGRSGANSGALALKEGGQTAGSAQKTGCVACSSSCVQHPPAMRISYPRAQHARAGLSRAQPSHMQLPRRPRTFAAHAAAAPPAHVCRARSGRAPRAVCCARGGPARPRLR
jgi:hypothetical protein